MLDITLKDLERILYFENYGVVEPGLSPLKQFDLLTEEQLYHAQDEYGDDAFVAKIGAEAIRDLLGAIDPEQERENIRQELAETTSELKPQTLVKGTKLVETFIAPGHRPERMVLTAVPVYHPERAALLQLD